MSRGGGSVPGSWPQNFPVGLLGSWNVPGLQGGRFSTELSSKPQMDNARAACGEVGWGELLFLQGPRGGWMLGWEWMSLLWGQVPAPGDTETWGLILVHLVLPFTMFENGEMSGLQVPGWVMPPACFPHEPLRNWGAPSAPGVGGPPLPRVGSQLHGHFS